MPGPFGGIMALGLGAGAAWYGGSAGPASTTVE
jgi:hypothetical protein